VYLHLFQWFDESPVIPSWGKKIKAARFFSDKTPVKFLENDFGITLKIPKGKQDPLTQLIIELEVK
jgi:alpha-L-fucosidase